MSAKPTYLGLLNAIALNETRAYHYLQGWIATTPDPEVRKVLCTVAAREGEHGLSFAKRINELGYEVREKDDQGARGASTSRIVSRYLRHQQVREVRSTRAREDSLLFRRHFQGSFNRHPHRRAPRTLCCGGARQLPPTERLLRPSCRSQPSRFNAMANRG